MSQLSVNRKFLWSKLERAGEIPNHSANPVDHKRNSLFDTHFSVLCVFCVCVCVVWCVDVDSGFVCVVAQHEQKVSRGKHASHEGSSSLCWTAAARRVFLEQNLQTCCLRLARNEVAKMIERLRPWKRSWNRRTKCSHPSPSCKCLQLSEDKMYTSHAPLVAVRLLWLDMTTSFPGSSIHLYLGDCWLKIPRGIKEKLMTTSSHVLVHMAEAVISKSKETC